MPERRSPAAGPVAALDIGGTKIEAGVVDHTGRILSRVRVGTPRFAGTPGDPHAAEELFELCVDTVRRAISAAGPCGPPAACADHPPRPVAALGVGCGGPMSRTGASGELLGVSPLNIPQWRGFPLAERLVDELALPVGLDNDAKALALAEGAHGAAVGVQNYLAMVVSTGVGGGIVLDGRLLDGRATNAGHIGHVVVVPDGRRCACGARGCLEAEVSGSAIEAATGAPAREAGSGLRRRCGRLVGRAVASVCNLLDLDLAVVSGSVAIGYGRPFIDSAQEELDRLARLEYSSGARIRLGGLGPDGPLVGAARVGFAALGAGRPA